MELNFLRLLFLKTLKETAKKALKTDVLTWSKGRKVPLWETPSPSPARALYCKKSLTSACRKSKHSYKNASSSKNLINLEKTICTYVAIGEFKEISTEMLGEWAKYRYGIFVLGYQCDIGNFW